MPKDFVAETQRVVKLLGRKFGILKPILQPLGCWDGNPPSNSML